MRRIGIAAGFLLTIVVAAALIWTLWPGPPNQAPTASFNASPIEGQAPLTTVFDATDSNDPDGEIVEYVWDFGDGQDAEGSRIEHDLKKSGVYTTRLTVKDSGGEVDTTKRRISVSLPAPSDIAPRIATPFGDSLAFLYSGDNRLQVGVEEDAIDPKRVAVLRGRVFDRGKNPLPGVKVCLLNDGKFGETQTRSDGVFDFVVNGGGNLTVCYKKDGYLPLQRKVQPDWHNFAWLPDVTLIPAADKVINVDLNGMETEIAVVRGSEVSDEDGKRQATLFIPTGTVAEMVFRDGSTKPMDELSIRMTEYTVGESGPSAMPAELPENIGYTYCLNLSADEADAAGAETVQFNKPVINYIENFLEFPVGTPVPIGFFDPGQGTWVPSTNGRIVEILSIDDGVAELDVSGNGVPADEETLQDLDVTEAELQQLASNFHPEQSL